MIILIFTFIYYIYLITGLNKAAKSRERGYYHLQFINIISAVIMSITNIVYPIGISDLSGNMKGYILIIGLLMDIILLITIVATVIIYKKQNEKRLLKYRKRYYLKRIFKFTIAMILIIYSAQSIVFIFQKGQENKIKDELKSKEIEKATSYLKNKYDISIDNNKCIYYSEEKYILDKETDEKTYVPKTIIFRYNSETITVTNRKETMSDNRQMSELNKIIPEYFSKKTNLEIKHVEINKVSDKVNCEKESIISEVIQTKYNIIINSNNIPDFMSYVLKEKELSIKLYIKNTGNKNNQINDIKKRIAYLQDNENIKEIIVYVYDDNIRINKKEFNYKIEEDSINSNRFGCYYVENNQNNISYTMKLQKESSNTNDWIIE